MTENKLPKRQRRKKPPSSKCFTDIQFVTCDEIFGAGFLAWYRSTCDAEGNLLPEAKTRGLTPPEENKQNSGE